MPADDYTAAVSGGLKLKGVASSSRVSKSHKKKRPKPSQPESSADANAETPKDVAANDAEDAKDEQEDATVEKSKRVFEDGDATPPPPQAGKTEAELRHEDHRRKRLDERLKREGTKTHKERVEELNRYLSNLSEHHDMYAHLFYTFVVVGTRQLLRIVFEEGVMKSYRADLSFYLGPESAPDKTGI